MTRKEFLKYMQEEVEEKAKREGWKTSELVATLAIHQIHKTDEKLWRKFRRTLIQYSVAEWKDIIRKELTYNEAKTTSAKKGQSSKVH
jgi:transposase